MISCNCDGEQFWILFDLIVHLAAIVGGRDTIENYPLAVGTDLSIDAEFFNWAVRTKQSKIIYFSSSAAYPIHFQIKGSIHKLVESDKAKLCDWALVCSTKNISRQDHFQKTNPN